MSKKLTAFGLIAATSFLLAGCTKPGTPATQSVSKTVSEAAEFADAIKSGKPTVCTMTKDGNTMEYLVSGKKMRVNTTTSRTDDKGVVTTTVGHMINDTAYLYTWDDKTKQGSKMAIPTEEEAKAMADKAKQYAPSTAPKLDSEADYQGYKDQGYTIDCKAGSVDDASFTPPSDVKFIDPTQMMKQVTGGAPTIDYKKLQEQYGNMGDKEVPNNY